MNSTCILIPVPEFLLVNSTARRFLMVAFFEGKFLCSFLYLLMHSLTIFGSAGICADNLCPANQWKCWKSDIRSPVFNKATVTRTDNNTSETYVGLTENDFNTRYRNHTSSFQPAHSRNSSELSKHMWDFKDNNIAHTISWNILASANKRCNLCLLEKFIIICQPERSTLNKRNELVSSCRHRNKSLLRYN